MGYVVRRAAFHGAGACSPLCDGLERGRCSDGTIVDTCCSSDLWDRSTYIAIKGPTSMRRMDEDRIVRLGILLQDPNFIDDVAWDAGDLQVQSGLKERIARAFGKFVSLYPPGRWTQVQGPNTDCTDVGYYKVWSETVSVPMSQAHLSVISSAPGLFLVGSSQPNNPFQLLASVSVLLVVQGGKIVPSAWLNEFLSVFAPGIRAVSPSLRIASSVKRTETKPRIISAIRTAQTKSIKEDTIRGKMSLTTKAVAVTGAVGLVYLLLALV
jgi:hypothetical protein